MNPKEKRSIAAIQLTGMLYSDAGPICQKRGYIWYKVKEFTLVFVTAFANFRLNIVRTMIQNETGEVAAEHVHQRFHASNKLK